MSNVMRPQGPLPPRVYWTRRLVLLSVVLILVLVAWWLFSGVSGTAANDQRAATTPTSTHSAGLAALSTPKPPAIDGSVPTRVSTNGVHDHSGQPATKLSTGLQSGSPPAGNSTAGSPQAGSNPARQRQPAPPPSTPTQRTDIVLAQPTGDCNPRQVGMSIKVQDSATGQTNPVDVVLTSTATPACRLAITPSSFELRVTSGGVMVWSSRTCPNALPAREVVVRAHPPSTYRFTWSGHLSNPGCRGLGKAAAPGGYWVEAALIGGNPQRAYFDVTAAKS